LCLVGVEVNLLGRSGEAIGLASDLGGGVVAPVIVEENVAALVLTKVRKGRIASVLERRVRSDIVLLESRRLRDASIVMSKSKGVEGGVLRELIELNIKFYTTEYVNYLCIVRGSRLPIRLTYTYLSD
jgi:ribosomal protein L4